MARLFALLMLSTTLLAAVGANAEPSSSSSPSSSSLALSRCTGESYSFEVLSGDPTNVGDRGTKGRHRLIKRGVTWTHLEANRRSSSFQAGGADVSVTIEDHPGLVGTSKFIMEMNAVSSVFMCFQVMEKKGDLVMGMCGSWDCGGHINRSAAGPIDAYKAGINESPATLWIRFRAGGKHVHDIYMDRTLLYGKVIKLTLRMT